ncbi:unnamed protein product [Thelazia callipaeda]|uniref:TPR_REGION domain-containing protein n=1 Tax=Thelazia callipaeda TaxID=103827 RepID=A0A0N5D292_THECL|nr:unnamed protein product [Thelazia callipaeda]
MDQKPFFEALLEDDCAQDNPLVDLSKNIVEGSNEGDFESGVHHFSATDAASEDVLYDDSLQTTIMSELMDELDAVRNFTSPWFEDFQTERLSKKWTEEFCDSDTHEQNRESEIATETVNSTNEMRLEFDQKLQIDETPAPEKPGFLQENTSVSPIKVDETATAFPTKTLREFFETYRFQKNNPHLKKMDAIKEAKQSFDAGLILTAILYLEAALQENQNDYEVDFFSWLLLGQCQAENGNDIQAIAAFKAALKLNPHLKEVHLWLAGSYINEGMQLEATEVLDEWISKYLIGSCFLFQSSTSVNPLEELRIRAQKVEDKIKFMLAKGAMEDEALFHDALSLVYNIKHEYDKAAIEVQLVLRKYPKDYVRWNRLGALLANGEHFEEAVAAYFEALEVRPSYVRARCNMGISQMKLHDYNQAIRDFILAAQLQYSCGPVATSVWTLLRAAIMRSYHPYAQNLLTAVNKRDLKTCIKLMNGVL